MNYLLLALAAAVAIYVFYFRRKVTAVKYKGAGLASQAVAGEVGK